jgi:hypothetical protein
MSAALMPRVRILAVCDDAARSEIEAGVFTLESVRYRVHADAFPCLRSMVVYLLLSYPRTGRFKGRIHVKAEDDKSVRLARFIVEFNEEAQPEALLVELSDCLFPAPGCTRSRSNSLLPKAMKS